MGERGRTWTVPEPIPNLGTVHGLKQDNLPFWPRERLRIYGNYKLLMKAEYLFFYIPTIIILGLVIPAFTTIYALEEPVASTMTVKVTGRQWNWVYEVESPTDDGDDDEGRVLFLRRSIVRYLSGLLFCSWRAVRGRRECLSITI